MLTFSIEQPKNHDAVASQHQWHSAIGLPKTRPPTVSNGLETCPGVPYFPAEVLGSYRF